MIARIRIDHRDTLGALIRWYRDGRGTPMGGDARARFSCEVGVATTGRTGILRVG